MDAPRAVHHGFDLIQTVKFHPVKVSIKMSSTLSRRSGGRSRSGASRSGGSRSSGATGFSRASVRDGEPTATGANGETLVVRGGEWVEAE